MKNNKNKIQNLIIQILAGLIIIATIVILTVSIVTPPAPCTYEVLPQDSGLTPTIYVDLPHGDSLNITFGVDKHFHAECQDGHVRWWVLEIDHECLTETITLYSDGAWSCEYHVDNGFGATLSLGGDLWVTPQGSPFWGWNNEPNIIIAPPYPGSESG